MRALMGTQYRERNKHTKNEIKQKEAISTLSFVNKEGGWLLV